MNSKSYLAILLVNLLSTFLIIDKTSGATWKTEVVDSSGSVGRLYTSIALDSSSNVHISYYDNTNYDLKYATNATGSWVTVTVDSSGTLGSYSSIALDTSDKVHISYYDGSNDNLKYATNATGSWVTTTVDGSGNMRYRSSITIDSSDKAHISHYDEVNHDLMYVTNATGSWVTTTVDSSGRVGSSLSIALDSSDNVHISYDDFTNKGLKYATNATGSWATTMVDISASPSLWIKGTSIALDSAGKVHISYYNWNTEDLKYATNATGSWVTTMVESSGDVGNTPSIAIDSSGDAYISYWDETNADLKYATNASGSWVTQTLDSDGDVGLYTSITLDSLDNAHISYQDLSNEDLKYATNQNCTYSLSSTSATFESPGGTGNVNVTTTSVCNLTATSNDPSWINVTLPGGSVTGNGTVSYFIDPNPDVSSRIGTMTIAGKIFTVTQEAPCSYSITPASKSFGVSGGSDSVSVSATSGCSWTASSNASWITVTSPGGSVTGDETVDYSVDPNTGVSSREGTMLIVGKTFTVIQEGKVCTYSISPTIAPFKASGGTGSVRVSDYGSCGWTAIKGEPWITIVSGSSGSGNGTVDYSVNLNDSISLRLGQIDVEGSAFTQSILVVQGSMKSEPAPDININVGSGHEIALYTEDTVSISVSLTKGDIEGINADWWVVADTPFGWWYYDLSLGWTPGLSATHQGQLFDLSPIEISNLTGLLPVGTYPFYFGVDMNMNGSVDFDQLYYDFVTVKITNACTFSISPATSTFQNAGGICRVTVSDPCNLGWRVTSTVPWIEIISSNSGIGSMTVDYRVSSNEDPTGRTGELIITSEALFVEETLTVAQTKESTRMVILNCP